MKLEVGKYFRHDSGRCVAVLGRINTWKWGPVLMVEETDPTGHSISCVEEGAEDLNDEWVEVGAAEWRREFGILEA